MNVNEDLDGSKAVGTNLQILGLLKLLGQQSLCVRVCSFD